MTTVDILLRYAGKPTESIALALAKLCEVYGVRALQFDRAEHTLRVEYDATRLNSAAVVRLVRATGLEVVSELSLIPPQPEPVPAS